MQNIRGRKRAANPPLITTLPQHSFSAGRSEATFSASFNRNNVKTVILAILLCSLVLGSFYLSYGVLIYDMENHSNSHNVDSLPRPNNNNNNNDDASATKAKVEDSARNKQNLQHINIVNTDKCAFRSYPKSRLYGLHDKSPPNFLSSDAMYIRGKLPIILNPLEKDNTPFVDGGLNSSRSSSNNNNNIEQSTPVKPCFDTTSWENLGDKSNPDNKQRLPFTDGHNPSVVSLAANPYDKYDGQGYKHIRLDPKHLTPITSAFPDHPLDNLFLGVTIFGNGQCKFGLSEEDVVTYKFSSYNEPPGGKRTILAVMTPPTLLDYDHHQQQQQPFRVLAQTTLLLERDDTYGTNRRKAILSEKKKSDDGEGYARIHQEFDDPRFFFHEGRLWILYRNGPLFGYNDQIHNPIHFEMPASTSSNNSEGGDNEVKFIAYIKASETVRVCCGRNIALISEETQVVDSNGGSVGKKGVEWMPNTGLKALTWVDPVTVVNVDVGDVTKKRRQLLSVDEADEGASTNRRMLGSAKPKSNIHGTNGYLVPMSSGELLGIAHFHRPEHRKESNYALHGHHYTHAFFTIARERQSNGGDTAFKLKRISNEFLFRSLSVPIGEKESSNDGDIIQFASGLDVYGSDIDGKLVLSYGINDCEGAILSISMKKLQQMLIEIEPGQEVADLMKKLKEVN